MPAATILVVDDEPALVAAIARILHKHGYQVLQANDGPSALELAATQRVDLLLTDAVMPNMSGPDLADALRRTCPGLPVIVMSGYVDGVPGSPSGVLEGQLLLEKPATPQLLLHLVREALADAAR